VLSNSPLIPPGIADSGHSANAPDYLGNYTLMAQHYCPGVGDKNLFYGLLTKVLTCSNSPDIPYYPENVHEKRLAEQLMMTAEKEDWFD